MFNIYIYIYIYIFVERMHQKKAKPKRYAKYGLFLLSRDHLVV